MKTFLYAFIVVVISFYNISATAQYPDLIIIKGDTLSLFSNPLEKYFELFPEKRPEVKVISTALWRGYVATFEIKESILYLRNIEFEVQIEKDNKATKYDWKSVIKEIFPNEKEIIVNWFSGLLVIPKKEIVNYVHMGYASEYESYTLYQFSNGVLEKEKDFNLDEYITFKEKQFEAFGETNDYQVIYAEMLKNLNEEEKPEDIEEFLRIFVIEYSTKFLVDF